MKHRTTILKTAKKLILTASLSAFLFPIGAQAQNNGLTPDHVAKIQSVTSTKISKDGKNIVYTLSKPSDPFKENKAAENHLFVYNTSSKKSSELYTSSSASSVDFRPNHNTITFLSKDTSQKKTVLYEMGLNGGSPKAIYFFDRNLSSYSWHSDGNQIAFTSADKADTSASKLPYKADVFEENRPNRSAYTINITSKNANPQRVNIEGSVYMVKWSPKGDHLAISVSPSPEVDDYYMDQKVKIVDPKNGNVIHEIDNQGKIGQMEWSPKGDQLAIKAGADINDPIDGRILIVSAKGGIPKIIDRDFKGKYEHIEWAKDKIYFVASEGTASMIGSIQADGKKKTTLFKSNEHVIRDMHVSEGGKIAFTANTPSHPTELFIMDNKANSKPTRLTHHNEFLNDMEFGKQEVITYKTRDGEYDIQGMLIYPLNYEEGTAVPTITVVHGGPEAHYGNGWLTAYSMPGQMAAAKGYAVFYPNYRGSTGRGIDFAYSSQRDMSGKEFDDIVDGVDYLIEQGIADKDRIGVTGGSYGGYASAWMSTYYSDRFAAAVMFVGISNNLSKWGSSDIPNELFYVHSRERMWESDAKWMDYLKRSPIYHVDKAETPLLIMHGANDPRVHPAQSLELYRHIKVRKPEVPVRLVLYPGEGHGNRKASAQYDYAQRMLQWFDTYLMTGDNSVEMPSWDVPMPEEN